jgi:membrane protein implicated in regulation of membrane protease activity
MSKFTFIKLLKEIFKTFIAIILLLIVGESLFLMLTINCLINGFFVLWVVATVLLFIFAALYLWASLYGVSDVIKEIKRK